jgi:lipid II:glycine glycyltransferase (peptidoglycan interpeptide bridge formation enzyme)
VGGFGKLDRIPASACYRAHTVSLNGTEEELFNRCDSSVRRAVRRARRCGIQTTVATDKTAVESFFSVALSNTEAAWGSAAAFEIFLAIQDQILGTGKGFVVLAAEGMRTVAAAVFFMFGNKGVYKFGASDDRFQESRGNNAVMWEGMRKLREAGCTELNLGRTSLGNEGLRRFKLGWGSSEDILSYLRLMF